VDRRRDRRIALAILWVVVWAIYALPWGTFSPEAHWERITFTPFQARYRVRDVLLNFVFYLPLGALGAQASTLTGTVLTAVLISGISEFLQVFATNRYPSATDVVTNVAGALIGYLAFSIRRHR
jgi:VanZ family protein